MSKMYNYTICRQK